MKKIVTYVLIVVAVIVGLVGCGTTSGGHEPSKSACLSAMKTELSHDVSGGDISTEPKACKGLSDKVVEILAKQALSDYVSDQGADLTWSGS